MLTKKKPKHIAMTMRGHWMYSRKSRIPIDELYFRVFSKINDMIDFQIRMNIPIITLYLLTSKARSFDNFPSIVDALVDFFEKLKENKLIHENKIKVSIIGKWYDMPGRLVEPIKAVINETRDYDSSFLNLCINYDGQEEIVDACRMIARRVQAGKIEPEAIDKENIKDAIYSSYFLPPDIIIKTGKSRRLKGFLLWDSTHSHIYFSGRTWMDLSEKDIKKAISEWEKEEG
ncbi:MAG: polyprenyl diphosphate synthase [Candidatus Woesearchaeota archaeon]